MKARTIASVPPEPASITSETLDRSDKAGVDALEALVADHRELEQSFEELEGKVGPGEAKQLLTRIRQEICRHVDAEVAALALFGSGQGRDRQYWSCRRRTYRQVEQLLVRVDRRSISSPDLSEMVEQVVTVVRQLMRAQETVAFPLLRATLTRAEHEKLARRVDAARRRGTSRPHPHLLQKGSLSRALREGLAPIDGLRDRMLTRL
jgi:hypothetical protein